MTYLNDHPVCAYLIGVGFVFAVQLVVELVHCWRKIDRLVEEALGVDER